MQTFRRIVVGIDFSECADRALEAAIALARAASATLTVAHVCEPDDDPDDPRLVEALGRVVAAHQHHEIEVTGVLRSGQPWEKLNNVAVQVGASLIVIGRGALGLGRVADRLVRCATRPVLVVA
jgi:nucleotide-binding universal stress UspA family protein